MINKEEKEIMDNWHEKSADKPMVSIICATYNHESHIAQALDSFLSQETNFPFEIIVHDDASTDGTADIIRQYESRYPHIMKPIYQVENQCSKMDGSIERAIAKIAKGEYQARCEGDDYWCDNKKIQKQYDYMTQNKDCAMCCHNTIIHDVGGKEADSFFNQWTDIHELTEADVFFGWNVHTSSYFYKPIVQQRSQKYTVIFGDYVFLTQAIDLGKVVALPDVMSVYNKNIPTGATMVNYQQGKGKRRKINKERIDYLREYNEETAGRFREVAETRMAKIIYEIEESDEKSLTWASKVLKTSKYYYLLEGKASGIRKLWLRWKYKGSSFGKLWYWSLLLQRYLKGH